tara:strand:+ start:3164 stop:4180 length:1017 start_codon:yes stop_codon:yes gene_type:complete
MTAVERLSLHDAQSLIRDALIGAGTPEPAALSVAAALVAAQAEGQVGHGFSRLGDYAAQVQSGKIRADAAVTVTPTGAAALHVDAGCGFAFPALDAALAAGLPRAQDAGICIVAVGNSHHCGALSVQVEKIAQAGLIGLMMANSPRAIAPWGAAEALYGTNPIAFATPQAGGEPLVIDLSLSRVARGKVMNAHKSGKSIPEGWALDARGNPTTDPAAALAGTMVPIGEAKGTALALMVELLTTAFTGSAFSKDAGSFFTSDGPEPRVGQTLIAIRPNGATGYPARVHDLLETLAAMPGARLPGARRRAAIARARAEGIDVPVIYLEQARALAHGGATA